MFNQQQRSIYSYHDGERTVWADPLELRRLLRLAAGQDPGKLAQHAAPLYGGVDLSAEDYQLAHAAEDRLVNAVRVAFSLATFDPATGAGATYSDALRTWNDFCAWLEKKNQNTGTQLHSAEPTESPGCSQI